MSKIRREINRILYYYKVYKNFINVILDILKKKELIYIVLKNGQEGLCKKRTVQVLVDLAQLGFNIINVSCKDSYYDKALICREICLWVRTNIGADVFHIVEIFGQEIYGKSFKGTVIDVGASNADSSIYFVIRGAERVIALEPFPESYELARENIKLNKLEEKIILLPYALTSNEGVIEFNVSSDHPNANSTNPSTEVYKFGIKFNTKIKVPTITLKTLVYKYNLNKIYLLKMDCEGCEYEVIRKMPIEILEKIENIILEFHNYPQDIPEILRKAGFETRYENKGIGILKANRKCIY